MFISKIFQYLLVLFSVLSVIFFSGSCGRNFGYLECGDDTDCPINEVCSPNGQCVDPGPIDNDSNTGTGDSEIHNNTDSVDPLDSDSNTDHPDSDPNTDPDSTTSNDSDPNTCPYDCLPSLTCWNQGGLEHGNFTCDNTDVCCELNPDSDSNTDDTDTHTQQGDCPYLCLSAFGCQSSNGTIQWEYDCEEFPKVCCKTNDIDSDSEIETDSNDIPEGCTTQPPVCLQDVSADFNSFGCCDTWSASALCPDDKWRCPSGYMREELCENFAPNCEASIPEGCGLGYPTYYPVGDEPRNMAIGQLNKDNFQDLVVTNAMDNSFSVLLGAQGATFKEAIHFSNVGHNPGMVKILDMNQDGIQDVAIAFRDEAAIGLFLGSGKNNWDGTFESKITISVYEDPFDFVVSDFNGDGLFDFAVTSNQYASPSVAIVLANGSNNVWDGSFKLGTKVSVDLGPTGIAKGHFDSDNTVDLAVACGVANKLYILYGHGDGTFSANNSQNTGDNPMFVTVFDFDQTGTDDILVCNQFSDNISVWLGNTDGSFEYRNDFPAGNGARSATAAFINSDVLPDVYVSNWQDDSVSLLIGESTKPGHFVHLDSFDTGDGPSKPIIEDLNKDGYMDVILASRGLDSVSVMLGYCDEE